MKKRIAAAALAAVLMFGIAADFKRASAAAPVVIIGTIGILTVELLAMMNGAYDDTAEAIGFILENGVEGFENAFIGSDDCPSWISTGWNTIFTEVQNLIGSGEITLDESGQAELDYATYLKLCQSLASITDLEISFGTDMPFFTFSYPINKFVALQVVPHTSSYYSKTIGSSYIPIFYNDTEIYFSYTYIFASLDESGNLPYLIISNRLNNSAMNGFTNKGGFMGTHGAASNADKAYSYFKPLFCFTSDGTQKVSYSIADSDNVVSVSTTGYLHYNGKVKETVSSVPDGLRTGYLCCDGQSYDFINSITTYVTTGAADIDDLSDVLPLDTNANPTIIIDSSGSITDVPSAVIVDGVPLSEYLENLSIDIDIPSIIIEKFPFCIPYDFYRIISCLCADPQPPIFRIPISTSYFGDQSDLVYDIAFNNETVRDYFWGNHLFEIHEEIVIDLSFIPLLQPISYTIFIVGFILLLIFITPKMIQH